MNKPKLSDDEVKIIIEGAVMEASRFAKAYLEQHGDGYPCGFAWVNVKPARGQFVKVMKQLGLGRRDEYYGGFTVWNPSDNHTQNMDAKKAGADEFARILRSHGLDAQAYERLD